MSALSPRFARIMITTEAIGLRPGVSIFCQSRTRFGTLADVKLRNNKIVKMRMKIVGVT